MNKADREKLDRAWEALMRRSIYDADLSVEENAVLLDAKLNRACTWRMRREWTARWVRYVLEGGGVE